MADPIPALTALAALPDRLGLDTKGPTAPLAVPETPAVPSRRGLASARPSAMAAAAAVVDVLVAIWAASRHRAAVGVRQAVAERPPATRRP